MPEGVTFGGNGEPGGGMGSSSDVKLQYIDDDPESYPNIFDNAKTDVSGKDEKRLIESAQEALCRMRTWRTFWTWTRCCAISSSTISL